MKLELKAIIFGALILFGKLGAEESERITGLWFVSLPGEWVGGGEARSYMGDLDERFYARGTNRQVSVGVGTKNDYWSAIFAPPKNKVLVPGVYKRAKRFSAFPQECPGLEIIMTGRCHGTLEGEFEILEIECNDEGKLVSFAANFIQWGESFGPKNNPPMFGGIRYNSSIPFESGFITKLADKQVENLD